MESIWQQNVEFSEYEKLQNDINTQVLIVGGGITGILCAYMLKNVGIECVVAEADRICSE